MSQENSLQSHDMNNSGENEAAQGDEKEQSIEGQSSFAISLHPDGSSSSSQPLETYQQNNITACGDTFINLPQHSKIDFSQKKDVNIRVIASKRGSQESNSSSNRSSWSEGFEKPSYYKNSANWSLSQYPQSELEKHFRNKGEKSIWAKQRLSLNNMKKQETEEEKDMSKMWVLFSIFEMQLNQQEAEKFLAGKHIDNKEIVLQETVEFCLKQAERKYQLWQFNHSQEKQASEYYIFPELFSRKQNNQQQSSISSTPLRPKHKCNLNESTNLNKQLLTHDGSVCFICLDAVNSDYLVQSSNKCNHLFCKECLFKYVAFCINNFGITTSGIHCPQEGCPVMLTRQEITGLLQNNNILISKYSRFKTLAQAKQSNIMMECIKPNCKGLMQINGDSICLVCPNCKSEACLRCHQAWHNGMKCSDALMFKYSEIRKDEVRCPHCLRDIRQSSTNQVKSDSIDCTWCYYKFCKLCGQKASLFHYSQVNCCFRCNEKEFKTISISSIAKSSCKYLCLFLFTLILYPIYLIGMALTFPLVTYFSRHNSSFGEFKVLKIIGLLVLGVIFFPFWFIFSIAPGTCIFISRTKKNILKRDPQDNGDPSN